MDWKQRSALGCQGNKNVEMTELDWTELNWTELMTLLSTTTTRWSAPWCQPAPTRLWSTNRVMAGTLPSTWPPSTSPREPSPLSWWTSRRTGRSATTAGRPQRLTWEMLSTLTWNWRENRANNKYKLTLQKALTSFQWQISILFWYKFYKIHIYFNKIYIFNIYIMTDPTIYLNISPHGWLIRIERPQALETVLE